ncbi:MAG: TIGR03067 domain-containing protein [Planctomycetota bacterium]|nr:TIGR03067 domain-containing protein [Planctomycetota bacterium]
MIRPDVLCIFLFTFVNASLFANDDAKTFTGDWEVAATMIEGNEVPADFNRMIQLKMDGKRYITSRMGEVVDEGTFLLMSDTKPAKIEIMGLKGENAGKKIRGIYKLEGKDKLIICYELEGKAYPETFEGKRPGMVLITYTRKKAG